MRTVRAFTVCIIVSAADDSDAQDSTSLPPSAPGREVSTSLKRSGKLVEAIAKRPVHPIVKGVVSGGGPGIGIAVDAPIALPWEFDADAIVTMRRFWSTTAIMAYHRRRVDVEAYGRVRDLPQLSYFGPGNETLEADRTDFGLHETVTGTTGRVSVTPWLHVGARVEHYGPKTYSGRRSSTPNTEFVFDDGGAWGWNDRPSYWRYQSLAELAFDPGAGESPLQGTTLRATWSHYDDRALDQYSFDLSELELVQRFALLRPYHRLTLHGLLSSTETRRDQTVPFYLLPSLGGKGKLRSVHESLLGTDGTEATLRGYAGFRFRDRRALLLQSEYRVPLWGPIEGTVFVDAGQVASRMQDLGHGRVHTDGGISVSLMKGTTGVIRTDLAVGAEGFRWLLSIGRDIVP